MCLIENIKTLNVHIMCDNTLIVDLFIQWKMWFCMSEKGSFAQINDKFMFF